MTIKDIKDVPRFIINSLNSDLIGKTFNYLTVVSLNLEKSLIRGRPVWNCLCECGNEKQVVETYLKRGETKSCGCKRGINHTKVNKYDLSGEFGIGYTTKGEKFYFDLEDYDLIKNYCWSVDTYLNARDKNNNCRIRFHKLVTNTSNEIIDHINHNKLDNRKCNLRICTPQQNQYNRSIQKTNKSGIIGVRRLGNWWYCSIRKNGISYNLGKYENFEDAIKVRLEAEAMMFGLYSPQLHLFNKYNVILQEDK